MISASARVSCVAGTPSDKGGLLRHAAGSGFPAFSRMWYTWRTVSGNTSISKAPKVMQCSGCSSARPLREPTRYRPPETRTAQDVAGPARVSRWSLPLKILSMSPRNTVAVSLRGVARQLCAEKPGVTLSGTSARQRSFNDARFIASDNGANQASHVWYTARRNSSVHGEMQETPGG